MAKKEADTKQPPKDSGEEADTQQQPEEIEEFVEATAKAGAKAKTAKSKAKTPKGSGASTWHEDVDYGDSLVSAVHKYRPQGVQAGLTGAREVFHIGDPADYTEPSARAQHSFCDKAQK
jgi:hypothetical protein